MSVRALVRNTGLFMLAFAFALASAAIQRLGPDHGIYCALGKSIEGYDIYCPKPKLNGGWPAAFLFDRPGISVEGKLFPVEDDFRWAPFAADVAFYLLLLLGLGRTISWWRRTRCLDRADVQQ